MDTCIFAFLEYTELLEVVTLFEQGKNLDSFRIGQSLYYEISMEGTLKEDNHIAGFCFVETQSPEDLHA